MLLEALTASPQISDIDLGSHGHEESLAGAFAAHSLKAQPASRHVPRQNTADCREHEHDRRSVPREPIAGACIEGRAAPAGALGYGRASSTRLNGVSVARRNRVNPASAATSPSRCSPACAPRPRPTSWSSEAGVQISVEAA